MKASDALQILNGDFSGIELAEGESHSDKYTEAYDMAKEALREKAGQKGKFARWYARRIKEYCASNQSCENCTFDADTRCLINHPYKWDIPDNWFE